MFGTRPDMMRKTTALDAMKVRMKLNRARRASRSDVSFRLRVAIDTVRKHRPTAPDHQARKARGSLRRSGPLGDRRPRLSLSRYCPAPQAASVIRLETTFSDRGKGPVFVVSGISLF